LREETFQHEARNAQAERNLLATKAIELEEAISLVESTRGNQARSSPHHADPNILVWVFRPQDWYIKFYLVDVVWFISFHRTERS
jgi:hypothetical protein